VTRSQWHVLTWDYICIDDFQSRQCCRQIPLPPSRSARIAATWKKRLPDPLAVVDWRPIDHGMKVGGVTLTVGCGFLLAGRLDGRQRQ
jgi:hypothetical protein